MSAGGVPKFEFEALSLLCGRQYDFWTDGKFSHCGIDAFELIKTVDGWKIAGGTYTIEANCGPSPLGPLKQ